MATFSSTDLTFPPTVLGTSTVGLLGLTNTGTAPLAVTSVNLNDTTNYSITDGCVKVSPLAIGAGCLIAVETHPVNIGTNPVGTITIADSASGSSQQVLLRGSGIFVCDPAHDADGDGLCDDWETNGLIARINGVDVFVDLPSMGADPNHKDIFIQADYMKTDPKAPGGAQPHDDGGSGKAGHQAAFCRGSGFQSRRQNRKFTCMSTAVRSAL